MERHLWESPKTTKRYNYRPVSKSAIASARLKNPRAYVKWNDTETRDLKIQFFDWCQRNPDAIYVADSDLVDIAKFHERSKGSISAYLKKLRIISHEGFIKVRDWENGPPTKFESPIEEEYFPKVKVDAEVKISI